MIIPSFAFRKKTTKTEVRLKLLDKINRSMYVKLKENHVYVLLK